MSLVRSKNKSQFCNFHPFVYKVWKFSEDQPSIFLFLDIWCDMPIFAQFFCPFVAKISISALLNSVGLRYKSDRFLPCAEKVNNSCSHTTTKKQENSKKNHKLTTLSWCIRTRTMRWVTPIALYTKVDAQCQLRSTVHVPSMAKSRVSGKVSERITLIFENTRIS